jgi:hypothetical protein
MTNGQRQAPLELAIGVVGSHDLVERIMLSPAATPGPHRPAAGLPPNDLASGGFTGGLGLARRLVAAAYRTEQEAGDKVLRLGPGIDAWLFASKVPYSYARRAGVLHGPATCVPLSGSALYAALLRASRDGGYDLSRLSVDTMSRAEVDDAFADLGVASGNVHVREDPGGAAALAAFHERLWRRRQTTVALTCLESVAQRLTGLEIPVLVVQPTRSAISSALRTATLLAAQRRLEDSQLAVAVVEVPTLREAARRPSSRQSGEELRLTVHRLLVQEAQRIRATVSPAGEYCFLVTATRGSLSAATDGFRVPPFTERARSELGIAVEVGVGLGQTAQDAEAHARAALARSHAGPGARRFALDREGHAVIPGPREPAVVRTGNPRGLATLSRLADKLSPDEGARVVDAETAGRLLGVTSRTARRLLHTLAEEGLAWPLPPSRAPQPGRPRQFYRLVTEKLDNHSR